MGLAPTRASRPLPVFETGSSSGRIASEQPCVSPARFERATFAFGTRRSAPLSYGELIGVDGRGRTCILRFRKPAPSPFGHVDMRAVDGTRTRILRRDGPALEPVELRQHVRALGLEPSLVPVKSRVPYPSGVTRRTWVGRESNPLCRYDGCSTGSCAPWRDRPISEPCGVTPMTMPMQLSRCWCPGLAGPARARLGRCRTPDRRCWRPRRHRGSSPRTTRMTTRATTAGRVMTRERCALRAFPDGSRIPE